MVRVLRPVVGGDLQATETEQAVDIVSLVCGAKLVHGHCELIYHLFHIELRFLLSAVSLFRPGLGSCCLDVDNPTPVRIVDLKTLLEVVKRRRESVLINFVHPMGRRSRLC